MDRQPTQERRGPAVRDLQDFVLKTLQLKEMLIERFPHVPSLRIRDILKEEFSCAMEDQTITNDEFAKTLMKRLATENKRT